MKNIYRIVSTLLIITACVLLFLWLKANKPVPEQRPSASPKPLAVKVLEAEPIRYQVSIETQAVVTPFRSTTLAAQVSGVVTRTGDNFITGGQVQAGEILIALEDQDYQQQLSQAKANLARARQVLATERGLARQAKREWRDLGNAEANALFLRQPQLAAAEADVAAAKASLELAELNIERTQIKAPFTGLISERHVDIGRYVTPGSPLVTLYERERVQIILPLSSSQLEKLELSPLAHFGNDAPVVTLHARIGGKSVQWQARLSHSQGQMDSRSQRHHLVAVVDQPFEQSPPLSVGQQLTARLQGPVMNSVHQIPLAALINNQWIWRVNEDKAEQLRVNVIDRDDKSAWITGDIKPQENIIISNTHLLNDGMTVSASMITP